jgi:hypothetical protein
MKHKTILESTIDSIRRAADHNKNAEEPPAAVLWTDHDRLWEPLIPELRQRIPHLLTLGPWDEKLRSGPAYWLRCAVARTLDGTTWDDDAVPVLYLPGVSRAELRQVNICPPEHRALAELQFRGAFWTQANSKDWTPFAFLTSGHGGLGLDFAADQETKEALKACLPEVFSERVVRFEGKRVDADEIRRLMNIDLDRDILKWMNAPEAARAAWNSAMWDGVCRESVTRLKFNPAKEDALSAAEALASLQGEWRNVWLRFKEAPTNYPGVKALLAKLQQPSDLLSDLEPYPALNNKQEAALQASLAGFQNIAHEEEARKRIGALEKQHGERRKWVWAELGDSPLAMALQHLVELADLTRQPLTGANPQAMRDQYEQQAWRVDAAMIDALAAVQEDASTRAVETALSILYKPWLERHAETFQGAVRAHTYPLHMPPAEVKTEPGLVVFFVDGLRYDAGQKLASLLARSGKSVKLGSAWTAVPSVTASGKVLASPAAVIALGEPDNTDFEPVHKTKRQPFKAELLRKTLEDLGWQVLGNSDIGDPSGCAWAETGNLDSFGHSNQLRLARDLTQQLDRVRERIDQLLAAGWKKVRVVTDHGWLLVPGKLDKVQFDKYLAESTWGRAAKLKPGAVPPVVSLPWSWCDEVQIAMAPGAKSFKAGEHYSHGGLSLQESLTPILEIASNSSSEASASIKSVRWTGLRVRAEIEGKGRLVLDLRTKASDASTSVVKAEEVEGGKASVVVTDDGLEDSSAMLVVVDEAGNVLAKQAVVIGGE